MADALECVIRSSGVQEIFHYLDDFLVVEAPWSSQCADDLVTLLRGTQSLGFPVAHDKVEGPTTSLTFLVIEVDTHTCSPSTSLET